MLKSPFHGCSIKCMYVCMYSCLSEALFYVKQIKNDSENHKYTLGHDRSFFFFWGGGGDFRVYP